jgi:hypothetical protein
MPHLPPTHHETSKRDSPNETKIKQNKTILNSNSNLAKSMTHHNQTKELTTWFLTVSPGLASKSAVDFLVEPQNQCGGGFPGLGIKTDNFGLVIWVSKSPRRFLGFGLTTKWASVCRLRHKTDGGRSMRDTRRDLATLLCVEVSLARVSQSGLKTGEGAMTGGACGTIAKVGSETS